MTLEGRREKGEAGEQGWTCGGGSWTQLAGRRRQHAL
jgi:hypothetical protein